MTVSAIEKIDSFSSFFNFDARKNEMDLQMKICVDLSSDTQAIAKSKELVKKVKLNKLQVLILKIINFVMKIFNAEFNKIDGLLTSNRCAKLLHRKYTEILNPEKMDYPAQLKHEQIETWVQSGLTYLQQVQFQKLESQLAAFEEKTADATPEQLYKEYKSLPKFLRELLRKVVRERYAETVKENPLLLLKKEENSTTAIEEIARIIHSQADAYSKLNALDAQEDQRDLQTVIAKNDLIFSRRRNKEKVIYDVSTEGVLGDLSETLLEKPITVTMVGVEYAGLVKQGGLAEALEGLSRGIKEQNEQNRVKLIFPKYSHLPKNIQEQLHDPVVHSGKNGTFNVYRLDINGVECYFIEDPSFVLSEEKPDIYGPDMQTQATRFAKFSELAAELIWEQKDTDVIHLHDWHVSGVGLKLKQDHQEEWQSGEIPPVLFTFHNNNRCAQGRILLGAYNYDPVVKGFQDSGITSKNDNLFVSTLMSADAMTTVSEMFGLESQQEKFGEGVSFAVRQAAKVGKLVGIVNGTNTDRWDPKTDPLLVKWKDLKSGEPLNLSYGPDDEDILEKKGLAREQLQLWTEKYMPESKIDFSKPLVTFIGRFDSYQKGVDKFEEAIEATLENGGQFIAMGMGEDPEAARILDKLEKKYKEGVLFVRDYKDPDGRIHFQQGNAERPGMGSLLRAVSDFLYVPSRFEPCGLVQFEGWLFGSLAIGSNTGGLADTIISPEKEENAFNGFLFEREGSVDNSAAAVVAKSLKFWGEQSDSSKRAIMSRLMKEGKKYGWHSSPRGFTPAEKYRFSYENAKRRIGNRGRQENSVYRIDAVAREIVVDPAKKAETFPEESYMQQYYQSGLDSAELYQTYSTVPTDWRIAVPSPYGKHVNHTRYNEYGAFYREDETTFRVYAPHALGVKVRLYDEQENLFCEAPMKKNSKGEWETIFGQIKQGQRYHYVVDGKIKIDPYSRSYTSFSNKHQAPYSIVTHSTFEWNDKEWMTQRESDKGKPKPMSIFEFHPTTWKRKERKPLNYRELASELVKHCKKVGYTHVEPMGILEHFYEESWGYQVSGYFAPNSRMGSVDDFKFMVDHLHANGIGIIMDWVPAHFAKDDYGLMDFDGSNLYEASGLKYQLSIRKLAFSYGCKHFDYSKKSVREFLISSAAFWLKEMHIDGLRVDCVRSMLNSEDQQSANQFMRDLNAVVHEHCPGAVTIAEEYSGDTSVTKPVWLDGLGFDMKWHVGWLKGALSFFKISPKNRSKRYEELKKAIQSDNFHKQVMALSHDDFHSKGLIALTPDLTEEEKLANLKAMLSFMMCLPGKKLLFMGSDSGNENSWLEAFASHESFADPSREKEEILEMIARLNTLYREHKELWESDNNGHDLEWIEDPEKKVHAYRRKSSSGDSCVCLHNFTDKERTFTIKCSANSIEAPLEIFNSDAVEFGGSGQINLAVDIVSGSKGKSYKVTIPPLTTVMMKEVHHG
ncbi:glycogen/starch synthase [Waddlia chondrophila]|uniref:Putative glycosidase/glycosyltransferase n=1 Tax=Waddlia chondrophila (strain ATCC VR-1470 / WSU 86-1044) TaxID=716544 RepID=D6YUJ8_WADCW|nr:glycogen/starch synthase [Waddlia chondrophila]ADI37809.1 putative glycosidase/glycosyltransferase [Waddlia chondrophila WSU 86-1044]